MVTLRPVRRALVPADSDAAHRISAPNYDEFQSDREIWELLQARPDNVLRITMSHCHVDSLGDAPGEGGPEALAHSCEQMQVLRESVLTKEIAHLIWLYEITSPKRPNRPQIGVGGFARTSEIRTERTPEGCIIRNEGIRPEKAEGRARLIEATNADFGTVNLAVKDEQGRLLEGLIDISRSTPCHCESLDEGNNRHRVWLIRDEMTQQRLVGLMEQEPAAYVADGNHRSAAAAALGMEHFLAVFFPASRLGLEPYNRLLPLDDISRDRFLEMASREFDVEDAGDEPYRPSRVHEIGLYLGRRWYRLIPKAGSYDPENAAEVIDADIVQRHIIAGILGIEDPRDKRINYVGGNKDARYLMQQVDAGVSDLAISLAPVTMQQFMEVCEQNLFMPPKSTWFDPKIRSGLVIALLD